MRSRFGFFFLVVGVILANVKEKQVQLLFHILNQVKNVIDLLAVILMIVKQIIVLLIQILDHVEEQPVVIGQITLVMLLLVVVELVIAQDLVEE